MKIVYGFIIVLISNITYAQEGPFYYPDPNVPNQPNIPEETPKVIPEFKRPQPVFRPYVPLVPNFYHHRTIGPDGYVYGRWSWYWGI